MPKSKLTAGEVTIAHAITAWFRKCTRENLIPMQPSASQSEDMGDTIVLRNGSGDMATYNKQKRRFVK